MFYESCHNCGKIFVDEALLEECVRCFNDLCIDCRKKDAGLCRSCVAAATQAPAPGLRGLAERDRPTAPGAVTDLRQTLDAQLEILLSLFEDAVKPGATMRRKIQAHDQFRLGMRFVRMLINKG